MYFLTYGLRKTWVDKCLKSPVSDDPSKSTMINWPSTVEILKIAASPDVLITSNAVILEKLSLSDMQNLRTGC